MYYEVEFIALYIGVSAFKKSHTKKSSHIYHCIAKSVDIYGRDKTTMIWI